MPQERLNAEPVRVGGAMRLRPIDFLRAHNARSLNDVTIGADPELFIYNTSTGKVVSSIGLIPGEKGEPWVKEGWDKGFGLEIDNILAEYNIPAVRTLEDWLRVHNFMKEEIRKFIKEKNPDLDIRHRASYVVDDDQLDNPIAKLFGCSADYNVYTQGKNPKPAGENTNLRSSGFHIHCGYKKPNVETSLTLIKYMDMYLGIPSVLIDPDTRRRELYGKAGCFRLTRYGFEYRTLSGYFLKDDNLLTFMWEGVQRALAAYCTGAPLIEETQVIDAINNNNQELARTLCEAYNLVDPKYLP